jgi:hypothetical protein
VLGPASASLLAVPVASDGTPDAGKRGRGQDLTVGVRRIVKSSQPGERAYGKATSPAGKRKNGAKSM